MSALIGGRLSSIIAFGRELLVTEHESLNPQKWGCYPMVPWAGRVRNGVFVHNNKSHQLEINAPPHAIHGTVLEREWEILEATPIHIKMKTDLGSKWPFRGEVTQDILLKNDVIECQLRVTTSEISMPTHVGWHPWFARPCTLNAEFDKMYLRDEFGIPTGELIVPTVGPHDDCFRGSRRAPRLNFENAVQLTIESDCSHWVVYDEQRHSICVEPQSGPPDGFTLEPLVATPSEPVTRFMRLRISSK